MASEKTSPVALGIVLVMSAVAVLTLRSYMSLNDHRAAVPAGPGPDHRAPRENWKAPGVPVPGQPAILFRELVNDFGRAMGGELVSHEFLFQNRGTADLEVAEIKLTCACTVPGDYDKLVRPGQQGRIRVFLHTDELDGAVEKSLRVITRSPEETATELWMKGTVWQPIVVKPTEANMGLTAAKNKPVTKTLRITNRTDEAVRITVARSSNPIFSAEVKAEADGKHFDLVITAKPPFQPGANSAELVLETTSEKSPKLTIAAFFFLQPPVEASPRTIKIPSAPLKAPLKRPVYIWSNDGGELKITKAEIDNPDISIQMIEETAGKRFRAVLAMPTQLALGEPATLTIHTSHPEKPELRVVVKHVK